MSVWEPTPGFVPESKYGRIAKIAPLAGSAYGGGRVVLVATAPARQPGRNGIRHTKDSGFATDPAIYGRKSIGLRLRLERRRHRHLGAANRAAILCSHQRSG
jgi:hypothetical protein